jgi:hypothetical protein
MNHTAIDHSSTPIRLFRSNFIEVFTHIHPGVVLAVWSPVILYFLWRGVSARLSSGRLWEMPVAVFIVLFVWTFSEYMLHRFVFHFHPRNHWQERVTYLFHGIHHHQPQCKTRLVMPPVVSIPMGLLFYLLFHLTITTWLDSPTWTAPIFGSAILGYLCYDMLHYATHHLSMRSGIWKFLKRYHMMHHFKSPNQRFGVSSPLWDYVFRTTG